ncbi:hypothetical protein [Mesorhizobium sp. WSM2239]|uniref:Uncharacterized protein n=2 Tax=unclassified Mesorhizobium TaxID=325217 RepID=A0AAU8DEA3_9HYPH
MFNVFYDTSKAKRIPYCMAGMSMQEALGRLAKFKVRYLDRSGRGRTYPNGRGRYDIRNARVEAQ